MLLDDFGQLVPPTTTCYWHAAGLPECCEFEPGECPAGSAEAESSADQSVPGRGGGQLKDLSEISDLTSTGRKRAAMLYPIFPGMVCEWSGLAKAGGGVEPIVGCMGNLIFPTKDATQGNVHHGPDKNVLNNTPQNVHRICRSCHSRWHHANNRWYKEPRPAADVPWYPAQTYVPHDSDLWATEVQLRAVRAKSEAENPTVADWTRRGVVPEDERVP